MVRRKVVRRDSATGAIAVSTTHARAAIPTRNGVIGRVFVSLILQYCLHQYPNSARHLPWLGESASSFYTSETLPFEFLQPTKWLQIENEHINLFGLDTVASGGWNWQWHSAALLRTPSAGNSLEATVPMSRGDPLSPLLLGFEIDCENNMRLWNAQAQYKSCRHQENINGHSASNPLP